MSLNIYFAFHLSPASFSTISHKETENEGVQYQGGKKKKNANFFLSHIVVVDVVAKMNPFHSNFVNTITQSSPPVVSSRFG